MEEISLGEVRESMGYEAPKCLDCKAAVLGNRDIKNKRFNYIGHGKSGFLCCIYSGLDCIDNRDKSGWCGPDAKLFSRRPSGDMNYVARHMEEPPEVVPPPKKRVGLLRFLWGIIW